MPEGGNMNVVRRGQQTRQGQRITSQWECAWRDEAGKRRELLGASWKLRRPRPATAPTNPYSRLLKPL